MTAPSPTPLGRLPASARRAVFRDGVYGAQRRYVGFMLAVIGRLLAAASKHDAVLQRELRRAPEGFVFKIGVYPGQILLSVRVRDGELDLLDVAPDVGPQEHLTVLFKHIRHAFSVFSFQESTAQAFAIERVVVDGDVRQAMRFMRCLDRTLSVMLPRALATRAVKRVPEIPLGERLPEALLVGRDAISALLGGSRS